MQQDPGAAAGSDAELITRVRSGDRAAYGTLYSRHSAAAANLARQFARSPAEVDDLVSEAFARVLDALLGGRGPDTAFRAYLFTTLRNTAFDRTRKDSKLQFTDDVAEHEKPEPADDPVALELENTMVAKAFAALPERWQVVLWHTQVEGQSPAEVGVLLGMTANAVTSLAFRAREGLREAYLQAHLADTAAERCRTTVDRLGGWARGGLSKREQAQVDAHLSECDRCRALAAELTEINSSLRGLLAPLLLGGAAAGYLATSSSAGAAVLVTGGAAAGVGAGAAGAAAGGSSSSGGSIASVLFKPWTLAAGGVAVAAAVVATLVITLTGQPGVPPSAGGPPAVSSTVTTSSQVSPVTQAPPSSAALPAPRPSTVPSVPTAPSVPTVPTAPPVLRPSARTSSPLTTPASAPPAAPAIHTKSTVASSSTPAPATSPAPPGTPSPSTSAPTTSASPPPTSALSQPRFGSSSVQATAGAPASLDMTVTNSGTADSAPQRLAVSGPTGVSLAGASAAPPPAQPPALRRQSALLAPTAAPAAPGPVTCTEPSVRCQYTVPAGQTITIRITLAIAPDAQPGPIDVEINGTRAGTPLNLTVAPALSDLRLGRPGTVWNAGHTAAGVPLAATVAAGVTDPGAVTIPLHNGDLWITDYPATCTTQGAAAIACAAVSANGGAATFGEFSVTLLPSASGPQAVTAGLAGARTAPVNGADGRPIVAVPLAPGAAIDMTGPFDGAIVGAAGQYCPVTDRQICMGVLGLGQLTPWQALDAPVALPSAMSGRRILMARVSWAVSPGFDQQRATGSATLDLDGARQPVKGQPMPIPQAPSGNIDDGLQQYSATLSDPTILAGHHTISVADLVAGNSSHNNSSHNNSSGSWPAMAAWTITLVWADPGADATIRVYSSPTLVRPGGIADPSSWTEPDPAPGPLEHLAIALWGVDDTGRKIVTAGTTPIQGASGPLGPIGCSPLLGLITPPGGGPCASVGFGLIDATAQGGSDTAGPITVTDAMVPGTEADTIWVSTVLVVRGAAAG